VLQMAASDVFIEDLNSTNGTYINGKPIKKRLLSHNDTVEIGKYKIRYLLDDSSDPAGTASTQSAGSQPPMSPSQYAPSAPTAFGLPPELYRGPHAGAGGLGDAAVLPALIKVLNGTAAGREVTLTKVVTTVGKPGVQVASITRRPTGYVFAHVEGVLKPSVNGNPLVSETIALHNGDVIELAGTQMQFVQG
jgi:hypothetical protein